MFYAGPLGWTLVILRVSLFFDKLLLKNESSDFDGSSQMSLKDAASHNPIVREPVSIRNRR